MNEVTYVLDVSWDVPGLPRLLGPFESEAEAEKFADLNVPNGTWEVRRLTFPYARSTRRVFSSEAD